MDNINESAAKWLQEFEKALTTRDSALFESLFTERANWRDLVAFTWNLRQFHGRDDIGSYLWTTVDDIKPSNFAIDTDFPVDPVSPVQFAAVETYEINFTFETAAAGIADGLVNVVVDESSPAGLRATVLFTRLKELRDHKPRWPQFGRYNHQELVNERKVQEARSAYADREPEVLIIGAGHNGVFAAAALGRLGIDALVIDKHERPGDSWRKRYEALVLHQPHGMLQFLHMPFPENFPDYISKDRLADWYEVYVKALDLNLWNSTEFLSGKYDEEKKQWSAEIRLADGSERTLYPKHLVLATGGSGTPRIPNLPGLTEFDGDVLHSEQFRSGADHEGKRVVIIGAGTSAHDIAFDVVNHGGEATMFQRGPIAVVDLPTANINYGAFNTRDVPVDALDKRWLSTQFQPTMLENFKNITKMGDQLDKHLHDGLEAVGFKLDRSEYGWFAKYFEVAGGYYINVGASEAVIRGDIKVRQSEEIDRFVSNGVKLNDGEVLEFDTIVLATGYENERVILERFFGKEVADNIGNIAGFDACGEPEKNAYRPIPAQPHLIITGSGICAGRWYAPIVALQIQAEIEGIVPESFKAPGHPSRTPVQELVAG